MARGRSGVISKEYKGEDQDEINNSNDQQLDEILSELILCFRIILNKMPKRRLW